MLEDLAKNTIEVKIDGPEIAIYTDKDYSVTAIATRDNFRIQTNDTRPQLIIFYKERTNIPPLKQQEGNWVDYAGAIIRREAIPLIIQHATAWLKKVQAV